MDFKSHVRAFFIKRSELHDFKSVHFEDWIEFFYIECRKVFLVDMKTETGCFLLGYLESRYLDILDSEISSLNIARI